MDINTSYKEHIYNLVYDGSHGDKAAAVFITMYLIERLNILAMRSERHWVNYTPKDESLMAKQITIFGLSLKKNN